MEIIGKVKQLGGLTEGTSTRGPWRKQDLIIETDEQYPKTICLTCWTNQVDEIQNMVPGQMIKAQIDISSREFNGNGTPTFVYGVLILSDKQHQSRVKRQLPLHQHRCSTQHQHLVQVYKAHKSLPISATTTTAMTYHSKLKVER